MVGGLAGMIVKGRHCDWILRNAAHSFTELSVCSVYVLSSRGNLFWFWLCSLFDGSLFESHQVFSQVVT